MATDNTLATRRKLAAARQAAEKARRYAGMADKPESDWDVDTLVERIEAIEKRPPLPSSPEVEIQAGAFRTRIAGLTGPQLVTFVVLLMALGLLAAVGRGWLAP